MGEAKRKQLALRGALLQARAALDQTNGALPDLSKVHLERAKGHIDFALSHTLTGEAPDPLQKGELFAAEFAELCQRYGVKAAAILGKFHKKTKVGGGLGADGIIRAAEERPAVELVAIGDEDVRRVLAASMKQ